MKKKRGPTSYKQLYKYSFSLQQLTGLMIKIKKNVDTSMSHILKFM